MANEQEGKAIITCLQVSGLGNWVDGSGISEIEITGPQAGLRGTMSSGDTESLSTFEALNGNEDSVS